MKIEILGMGCPKCKQLEANAREAVSMSGKSAEIVKVDDMDVILDYKVLSTPALVIDGEVKSTGKLLTPGEIAVFL